MIYVRYFDLHCDTLGVMREKSLSFYGNGLHVDLEKAGIFETYIQCCAAFIPDEFRGEEAYNYFLSMYGRLQGMPLCKSLKELQGINSTGGIGLISTIEGGAVLAGKLQRVRALAKLGVKMITLTWNGDNELGGGIGGSGIGLTPFGIEAVKLMEQENIVVDISHASEKLFEDLCANSSKSFAASHSNAKALCSHRRNLSDWQIDEMVKRGCLIGVNFYRDFLEDEPLKAGISTIADHVEYFLKRGAENCLAMGSDFDGCDIPEDMEGISSVPSIYKELERRGHSNGLLDKIFYQNAYHFFCKSFS